MSDITMSDINLSGPKGKKVAIIGSGMAGLSAAWLLSEDESFDVTMYETQAEPGLGAHSVELKNGMVVDVPLRIVAAPYYPDLLSLYQHLGVNLYTANSAISFSFLGANTYFRYISLLYHGRSIPFFTAVFSSPRVVYRVVRDLAWFCLQGSSDYHKGLCHNVSIGTYLRERDYSEAFIRLFLIPIFAVVCSCTPPSVLNYPCDVIMEYFIPVFLSPMAVKRVSEGVKMIGQLIIRKSTRFLGQTGIEKITKIEGSDKLLVTDSHGNSESYDEVIVCTQAKDAVNMVKQLDGRLATLLSQVNHEYSEVLLHTDDTLMPKKTEDWCSMNLSTNMKAATVTCWLNRLQPALGPSPLYLETWNPIVVVEDSKIISKSVFDRPIVTVATENILKQLAERQGDNHLWLCGSYYLQGIPLLDNACNSGLLVAEALGAPSRPWKKVSRTPVPGNITLMKHLIGAIFIFITSSILSILTMLGLVMA